MTSTLEAKRHFEKMPVHESFGVPKGSKWPENGPKMGLFRSKTGLFRYESSTSQLFQIKLLATKKPAHRKGAGRRAIILAFEKGTARSTPLIINVLQNRLRNSDKNQSYELKEVNSEG